MWDVGRITLTSSPRQYDTILDALTGEVKQKFEDLPLRGRSSGSSGFRGPATRRLLRVQPFLRRYEPDT